MADITTTADVQDLLSSTDYAAMRGATKLNFTSGATVNSSDAVLLARSNHTGTQLASTISNYASTLAGTTNTTPFTPSADNHVATKKYVDDNVGAGDVVGPASAVDDRIATFDSTTGKLIQDGGSTVANVLDRANHTGTQVAATISDFQTQVSANSDVTANTAKVTNATHTGDVTGSGALTIAADAVTYDKMQDTSATDVLLGRETAGAGTVEEIACTAAGRALLDDADAAAQRVTMGAKAIQHYKDFSLPAGAWRPADTNGAEASSVADLDAMAFDASTEESVWMQFQMPEDYNGGVLRWRVDWDAVATASGTAVFGLAGAALTDSDALTTAVGTERTLTDTLITVGDLHQTANDGTGVTLAGSPAAGNFVKLELVVKTSGTIAVDVLMLNVQIQYQTKTTEPAVWS